MMDGGRGFRLAAGVLGCRCAGVLVCCGAGVLVCCGAGVLVCRVARFAGAAFGPLGGAFGPLLF